MSKNITSDTVVSYHKYMAKTFGFKIFDKSNAIEMQLLAKVLKYFAPIDAKSFLEKFSSVLYNRVYIPYTIGDGTKSELFRQIRRITHETQHVSDFVDDPLLMIRYLALDSERGKIEANALATEIYLQWWYNGTIPNLTKMAEKLYYYGLEPNDQIMVRAHLQIHIPIARRGRVPNNFVARKGIAWLNRHCK